MEKVENKAQVNEHKAENAAEKTAETKAKKAEAAKRFNENQKKRKEGLVKAANELKSKGLLDKLSPEAKAFFEDVLNPKTGSFGGVSFLNKVFGDQPKVGDSVTLIDYMKRTLKSKVDLDRYVKQWAEKGTIVEFKQADNLLNSTYTITKLA